MTKKRKALTRDYVPCSVTWCAALCAPESDRCVVHRGHADVHPQPLEEGERFAFVPFIGNHAQPVGETCHSCGDTGECATCDGTGEHRCGECSHEHECGACDGSGDCPECDGIPAIYEIEAPGRAPWEQPRRSRLLAENWNGDKDWATRYLRAMFLPAYLPPGHPDRSAWKAAR